MGSNISSRATKRKTKRNTKRETSVHPGDSINLPHHPTLCDNVQVAKPNTTAPTGDSRSLPPRPTLCGNFQVAIFCALPLEADAVHALFDINWEREGFFFDKALGDPNAYSIGAIDHHNVVLVHMPAMGKVHAATMAASCRSTFPSINLALVVGICGVVPFGPGGEEIVLGDVIISDSAIQYDFGRRLPGRFERKDTLLDSLGRPNSELRGLLAKLKLIQNRELLGDSLAAHLHILQLKPQLSAAHPGIINDKLFEAAYQHLEDQKSCERLGCNGKLVRRKRLDVAQADSQNPAVHFGLMASGRGPNKQSVINQY